MERRQTTISCSAIALTALFALTAAAQTTPLASRAIKQTHAADDKTPLSLFPLKRVWTLALNNALTAPPAFREAYAVFPLEGDQLAAYDLSSGSQLWLVHNTTTAEPALGVDKVFVVDAEMLTALALRTGDIVWMQPFDAELATAPTVIGDRLIVCSADGDIVALRASDGSELWRRHLPRAATSRPAASDTRLFVATADSHVVAVNLQTGDIVWDTRLGGVGHDVLVSGDRIFLGSQDRFFYCLDVKKGEVAWRWPTGADTIGEPIADEKTVYFVALDNVLRGLNRSSGVQRWKAALPFRPISGPLEYRETLVVSGTAPQIAGYSTRDGKSQGQYMVSTELSSAPHLFADPRQIFAVLATISSDIVGRATVTGATRDIEPAPAPLNPLPNATEVPKIPDPPADLGIVSALPNLIPVVAPADQ